MNKKLNFIVAILSVTSLLSVSQLRAQEETDKPSYVLIQNVNIFDGVNDVLKPGSVLIENNLIKEVGDNIQAPDGASLIDGDGRTLMPGLIDAHVHLTIPEPIDSLRNKVDWMYWGVVSGEEARRMLLRGFTTVRDAGGPAIGLARAIDQGKLPGPRVYPSGPVISQTSGHGEHRNYTEPHPNMPGNTPSFFNQHLEFLADGKPEVLRATREALRLGATQIKLMAGGGVSSSTDPLHTVQFLPEELKAEIRGSS
jgi:imidazolonepropionase-like amidohydrolase